MLTNILSSRARYAAGRSQFDLLAVLKSSLTLVIIPVTKDIPDLLPVYCVLNVQNKQDIHPNSSIYILGLRNLSTFRNYPDRQSIKPISIISRIDFKICFISSSRSYLAAKPISSIVGLTYLERFATKFFIQFSPVKFQILFLLKSLCRIIYFFQQCILTSLRIGAVKTRS